MRNNAIIGNTHNLVSNSCNPEYTVTPSSKLKYRQIWQGKISSIRFILLKCLFELPVLLFFVYLASLCKFYHNREYIMQDYTLTYDHFWYFHHRLKEWSFPHWNPYVLSGVPAVLWNFIPASIFSPIILLLGLTLDGFRLMLISNTFFALLSIYLMGRFLGYGRLLPLLPVTMIAGSGYLYYAANPAYIGNFVIFYPLSVAALIFALKNNQQNYYAKWGLFGILLALSITGFRLENVVHGIVFLLLLFIACAVYYKEKKRTLTTIISGLSVTFMAILANSWHLTLLVHSTFNNSRLSRGKRFDNPLLWNGTLSSILSQPNLLLVAINFSLLSVLHYLPFKILSKKVTLLPALLILGAKLSFVRFVDSDNIAISPLGIFAVIFAYFLYTRMNGNITVRKFLTISIALFSGFYVSEYSWHTFPINLNQFFFAMPKEFSCLLLFGSVSLMLQGRFWMVIVLILFHIIGETGSFILLDVFGFPWLASRAFLWEIPFLSIMMMETALFLVKGIISLVDRYSQWTKITVQIVSLVVSLLTIKSLMLPLDATGKNYREQFPYLTTPINYVFQRTQWFDEAYNNAITIKNKYVEKRHSFQRVRIKDNDDDILAFSQKVNYYKFLPAYSGTLNTAPAYLSEIPKYLKMMFSEGEDKKKFGVHPELNPASISYKMKGLSQNEVENELDYVGHVSISIHKNNNPVYRELLAEEGSHTPRIFLTDKVALLTSEEEEYKHIRQSMQRNPSLTEEITTSDPLFLQSGLVSTNGKTLKYNLEVERDLPEHVVINLSTNKDAYLALLDTWDTGWKVYVDGKLRQIYRGYMGMRFLPVLEGTHKLEFRYCTPGFNTALVVSVLSWFLLSFVCFKSVINSRLTKIF